MASAPFTRSLHHSYLMSEIREIFPKGQYEHTSNVPILRSKDEIDNLLLSLAHFLQIYNFVVLNLLISYWMNKIGSRLFSCLISSSCVLKSIFQFCSKFFCRSVAFFYIFPFYIFSCVFQFYFCMVFSETLF